MGVHAGAFNHKVRKKAGPQPSSDVHNYRDQRRRTPSRYTIPLLLPQTHPPIPLQPLKSFPHPPRHPHTPPRRCRSPIKYRKPPPQEDGDLRRKPRASFQDFGDLTRGRGGPAILQERMGLRIDRD
ncbi:hypothetical protein ACFX2A_014537 [Malus domestica]